MNKRFALLAVWFAFAASSAEAIPVISHVGSNNPTTEGWTFVPGNGSVAAGVFDSEAVWSVTDGPTGVAANHYLYNLTPTNLAQGPWKITARFGGVGHVNEDEVAVMLRDGARQYQFTIDEALGGRFRQRQGLGFDFYTGTGSSTDLHTFTISSSLSDTMIHFTLDGGTPVSVLKTSIGFVLLGNEGIEFGGFGGSGDARTGHYQLVTFDDGVIVPEPSTAMLLGLGLLGLAVKSRRRRARNS